VWPHPQHLVSSSQHAGYIVVCLKCSSAVTFKIKIFCHVVAGGGGISLIVHVVCYYETSSTALVL
jgi:hypothetical protein